MVIVPENGKAIRGDLVHYTALRSDLSPVPSTVEATIKVDDELKKLLSEGKTITVNSDVFYIVKSVKATLSSTQGSNKVEGVQITALLDSCKEVAFIRTNPIIKERATLAEIYRASGARLRSVDSDFSIPRFSCFSGFASSYYIAQALQEEGGLVRWKNGKMRFFRLQDFFKQRPVITIQNIANEDINSEFLERHEVPSFYSIDSNGSFVNGNKTKSRSIRYSPFKNALRLQNMTRCLIHEKTKKIEYNLNVAAGDLVDVIGAKPLVVVTAAHLFENGSDGAGSNQYTKLWLSRLES